jgi:LPXTG-motif cell wall-anchored protein
MLMLVASGHWSARKTVQLVALGGAVVVLLYMVVRNPDVLRFIGGSPWGWPVVAGGAVTAGGWVWWRRRKRAIPEARGLPEMASKHGPQLIGNDRDTAQEATDERPGVGR